MRRILLITVFAFLLLAVHTLPVHAASPCFCALSNAYDLAIPSLKFGKQFFEAELAFSPMGPGAASGIWFDLIFFGPSPLKTCSNPAVLLVRSGNVIMHVPVVRFKNLFLWLQLEYVPSTDKRIWFKMSEDSGLLPNQVFVTSVRGDGKLGSWADAGGKIGLAAGDAICQARAKAAGLPGTFKAWLSNGKNDAYCRIHNLNGKVSDNCGMKSLPMAAGPWVRTDGVPFSGTIDETLSEGKVFAPPRCNEFADCKPQRLPVFTATGTDGALNKSMPFSCSNWTDNPNVFVTTGFTERTSTSWTNYGSAWCSGSMVLMCFQTGKGPDLPVFATPGKRVFLTSIRGNGNLASWPDAGGKSGVAAGDAVCRALASAAGLSDAGRFKAWLSSSKIDAKDHIASDGPWVRLDGMMVAENKADLLDGTLFSPINLTETGTYIGNYAVWTGTKNQGLKTKQTCSDWTKDSSSLTGVYGVANAADSNWSRGYDAQPCDFTYAHLYCFED